ncbi:hypothetical protein ACLOJK_002860 [Asimina triloba]
MMAEEGRIRSALARRRLRGVACADYWIKGGRLKHHTWRAPKALTEGTGGGQNTAPPAWCSSLLQEFGGAGPGEPGEGGRGGVVAPSNFNQRPTWRRQIRCRETGEWLSSLVLLGPTDSSTSSSSSPAIEETAQMGSAEGSNHAKPTKPAAATQELPTTLAYPDWTAPMQAYYGAPTTTPPFFPPSVATSSPPPHPYMWGGQHLMPPYGTTPLPYPPIYPHGGMYAHPHMALGMAAATTEALEATDKGSMNKSGGNSRLGGKSVLGRKAASGSGHDDDSQSGESGSEASDGSDDNANQSQELSEQRKRSFNQMLAEGANAENNGSCSAAPIESSFHGSGQPTSSLPVSLPGKPAVPPATNLNIGMDLWNSPSTGSVPVKARSAATGVPPSVIPAPMVGHEGAMPDSTWIADERELKKQRRKQSNRESARRSRLRKQAECEELAAKVEKLSSENQTIRAELQRLAEECEKLSSENASIIKQLTHVYGEDALSSLEDGAGNVDSTTFQSAEGEVDGHSHENSRGSSRFPGPNNGNFFSSNGKHE